MLIYYCLTFEHTLMSRKEPENLQEVLQVLARKLPAFDANDDDEGDGTLSIGIRRSFLLLDALREGHKKKFNPSKNLKVCNAACPSLY